MEQRRLEDNMRQRRREEREEKEVEKLKEDRRIARDTMSNEEKHRNKLQQLSIDRMKRLTEKAKSHYDMQVND